MELHYNPERLGNSYDPVTHQYEEKQYLLSIKQARRKEDLVANQR